MSKSIDRAFIGGHLTKDPEIHVTKAGTKLAAIRVAVNRRPVKGNLNPCTDFIDSTIFGRNADVVEKYLKKGSHIYIEGRLQSEKYTVSDGSNRYSYRVICNQTDPFVASPNGCLNKNLVVLMGRISTKNFRANENPGKSRCTFSIALDRDVKADENGKRPVDFIPIKCFGSLASYVDKYFKVGDAISVEGYIDTSDYTKQDGTKGYTFGVIAREIDFAERKKSEAQKPVYDNAPVQSAPTPQGQNEDHNNNQEQFNTNFQNPPFGNPDDFNDFEDPFGGFGGFEGSLDGNLPFQ